MTLNLPNVDFIKRTIMLQGTMGKSWFSGAAWGRCWAVQRNGGFSLGLHIEPFSHRTNDGTRYGPYLDLHLIQWVVSVGVNPIYAGDAHLHASYSRGGLS